MHRAAHPEPLPSPRFGVTLLIWVLLLAPTSAHGQTCPNRWTADLFPGRPGLSHEAYAAIDFDDGSGRQLYVAGEFEYAGGVLVNRIGRWNGNRWSSLGAGFSFPVYDVEVYDDGTGPKLYACGAFSWSGDTFVGRVARWTGAAWEPLATGLNGAATCMSVQDLGDGPRLFVGGQFSSAGGVPASNVAMWDGNTWTPVGAGIGGPGAIVRSLLAVSDESGASLIVGGTFSEAGSETNVGNIARWNGEAWLRLGNGVGLSNGAAEVNALHVMDSGGEPRLYVGGSFDSASGVAARQIASWDGTVWRSVGGGLSSPPRGGFAYSLADFDFGNGPELVAGGLFTFGISGSYVARFNGSEWINIGQGITNTVVALLSRPSPSGAQLLAFGVFSGYAFQRTGTTWGPIGPNGGRVRSLGYSPDVPANSLFVGGEFAEIAGVAATNIASWDGTAWQPLGLGVDGAVEAITFLANANETEKLIVGGAFGSAGGQPANRVAQWDGTSWTPLGLGLPGTVQALAVWNRSSGAELIAGGSFGVFPFGNLARWNGAHWTPLATGVDGRVNTLAVHDPGGGENLYVGGDFTGASGIAAARVAMWDGQTWHALGAGLNGSVTSLVSFDDGNGAALYAAGYFQQSGTTALSRIARWTGTVWVPVGGGVNGYVNAAFVHDFGQGPRLVVSGGFSAAGGGPIREIAVWDGVSWSEIADDVDGFIEAYATFDDGHGPALFCGGNIHAVDGVISGNIGRYGRPASIVGDFNDDCTVGLTDLALLLRAFGLCANDPGFDPLVDVVADGCIDLADLALLLSQFGLLA